MEHNHNESTHVWQRRPREDRSKLDETASWDCIVVGAGVVGCALAYKLGVSGSKVLLIERDLSTPDRIVGELLQPGGLAKLRELGLGECVESIDAQPVEGYVMSLNGAEACIDYPPFDEDASKRRAAPSEGEPAEGRSFHNGRFVQMLRHKAESTGKVAMVEASVVGLIDEDGLDYSDHQSRVAGVKFTLRNGGSDGKGEKEERKAKAHLTAVCDGMFSNMRSKLLGEASIGHPSHFVGLILEGISLPRRRHAFVILSSGSPVLLYPVSSREVRCLIDIPGGLPKGGLEGVARHIETSILPELPEWLQEGLETQLAKRNFKSMQNKTLSGQPASPDGAVLLGDSFNMRHPLTGGGMTVALQDAKLLTDSLVSNMCHLSSAPNSASESCASCLSDLKEEEIRNVVHSFYRERQPRAATINTLANALHRVFTSNGKPWRAEMRRACFDYLRLGGAHSQKPVALLGGLCSNPFALVLHFFLVAVYGVGRLMFPIPSVRAVSLSVQLLAGAFAIIVPILYCEGFKQVFLAHSGLH